MMGIQKTDDAYCIRRGYRPRLSPAYFDDIGMDGKVWQPDVYPAAALMARLAGLSTILDIGCGRGTRLYPLHNLFRVIGADFGANIAYCRKAYAWGEWIECDLEREIVDIAPESLKRSIIVCADVIEHLVFPDNLLATIMMCLACAKFAVLTTPDRLRTYGHDHNGPPANPHHVREWTLAEQVALWRELGINVCWSGWTRSNDHDGSWNTCMLVLSRKCDSMTVPEEMFALQRWDGLQ